LFTYKFYTLVCLSFQFVKKKMFLSKHQWVNVMSCSVSVYLTCFLMFGAMILLFCAISIPHAASEFLRWTKKIVSIRCLCLPIKVWIALMLFIFSMSQKKFAKKKKKWHVFIMMFLAWFINSSPVSKIVFPNICFSPLDWASFVH